MQSLDGLEVRWCRSRDHLLPGLKSDEFHSMVIGSFFPVESEKELRETSAGILGSLVNGKSRPRAWHVLRVSFEAF